MQHRTILFLVTAALITPAAAAWSVNGAFEPDTPDDVLDGRMFLTADTEAGGSKVYFNAHPSDRNTQLDTVNPNLGGQQTRILVPGQMGMNAWLGIWKDCNGDDFIGHVESALLEYRAELLLDDATCPPDTLHNSDGWVSEFIPLSPTARDVNDTDVFPKIFHDEDVQVWGDFGRPDVANEVHYDCLQAPFPSGSFDSTAGFLRYFDCQAGYNIVQTINDVDAATGLGIGFDDKYDPAADCDNPLNVQINAYGRSPCSGDQPGLLESNTTTMASVWDCSGEPLANGNDTGAGDQYRAVVLAAEEAADRPLLNENFLYGVIDVDVYNVAPSPGNPEGSAFSTVAAASDPCADPTTDTTTNGEFLLGADFSATNPRDGKRLADFEMGYASFGSGSVGAVCLPEEVDDTVCTEPSYHPGSYGVLAPRAGHWGSSFTYLPPTYMGGTVRTDNLEPAAGIWFTVYAHVGAATLDTLSLPTTAPGIYGAEACGSMTDGVSEFGWDCNPDNWYNLALGGSSPRDPDFVPRPGETTYHLRDTDCYDGMVVDGVYASLATLSSDPVCPSPFA